MQMITHRGDFIKTITFLNRVSNSEHFKILSRYGQEGVNALSAATPVDSGKTAASWGYEVKISRKYSYICWTNSNVVDGTPIAILLQYGHGTAHGGYVEGKDYINPAVLPVFDRIIQGVWKEVTSP